MSRPAAFAFSLAMLLLSSVLPASCAPSTDTTAPPGIVTSTTDAPSPTGSIRSTVVPPSSVSAPSTTLVESDEPLVILLQDLAWAGAKGMGLPRYAQYKFALYPDGRAFWQKGPHDNEGDMVQAKLNGQDVALLRSWVREAGLAARSEYRPAGDMIRQALPGRRRSSAGR